MTDRSTWERFFVVAAPDDDYPGAYLPAWIVDAHGQRAVSELLFGRDMLQSALLCRERIPASGPWIVDALLRPSLNEHDATPEVVLALWSRPTPRQMHLFTTGAKILDKDSRLLPPPSPFSAHVYVEIPGRWARHHKIVFSRAGVGECWDTWLATDLDTDTVSQGESLARAVDAIREAVEMVVRDDLEAGLNPLDRRPRGAT